MPGPYSNRGSNSPASPRRAQSTVDENGVSSVLISITLAPACLAYGIRLAAGYTLADVPITRKTWAEDTACSASFIMPSGSGSPNQTTPGRARPPQAQCGGSFGRGTLRLGQCAPHTVQRRRQISPWSRRILPLPARSCRPSTFCVIRVYTGFRISNCTSALWAELGAAFEISSRRQLYHSQTRRGSLAKASGVARSSGLYSFQRPASPRKVGTPLSAEMPAPLKTATESAWANQSRA